MRSWSRARRLLLCTLLGALFYLPGLGRPALWEPDEGRYAEVAREMALSHDYVTPRNDWVRYFEKPPLVYWLTAGALKLLGNSELAARLPAALFSIGQIVIVAALGEEMFGVQAGLLAALCLGLSPIFFGFARFATLDPALAFFVIAALASFYAATREPVVDCRRGRLWFLVSAAAMALGTLTKGPVAVVLSAGPALVYLLIERRGRSIARIPWIGCALLYSAITLPWFALAASRNSGFLSFFLLHENVKRYLASLEHEHGIYFFIPLTLVGTWPWVAFAVEPLWTLWHKRIAPATHLSALNFLVVWFSFIFVFFSIPRSKLGAYILPAIPAIAIICAYGLDRLRPLEPERRRRLLGWFALANLAVVAVADVALSMLNSPIPNFAAIATDAIIGTSALAIGATVAFAVSANRSWRTSLAVIIVSSVVAMGALARARIDSGPLNSYRDLARAIVPYTRQGCLLASYRHHVQSLPFYTGSREVLVDHRGELLPFSFTAGAAASFADTDRQLSALWSSKQCVVLVANRRDLASLTSILNPAPAMIAAEGKKVALCNYPAPPAGPAVGTLRPADK